MLACIPHLNPSMAAQVEVKLRWVCDGAVHCGACWDIATFANLQRVASKITVTVLHDKQTNSTLHTKCVHTLSALSEQKRRVW